MQFEMERAADKVVIGLSSIYSMNKSFLLRVLFSTCYRETQGTTDISWDPVRKPHVFRIEDESFERKGPEIVLR